MKKSLKSLKNILICLIIFLGIVLFNGIYINAQSIYPVTNATTTAPCNNVKTVVKDGAGNYYAVYSVTYSSYSHIFVRKSEDNGATWKYWNGTSFDTSGGEVPIESSGNYHQYEPSIAIDSNNDVHVVWRGLSAASAANYQVRYSKFSGGAWSAPVNVTSGNYWQMNPSIAIGTDNTLYLVWYGYSAASAAKYQLRFSKNSGSGWDAPVNITSETTDQKFPSVVLDSNNDLHVVWNGYGTSNWRIKYMKYSGGSWSATAEIPSENYDQMYPTIAVDSGNNPHVVWNGYDSATTTTYQIRYSKNSGGNWSVPVNITRGTYQQYNPSIAIDTSNNIYVLWHGKSSASSSYNQIRYSRNSGIGWSVPINVTSGTKNQQYPLITKGADGFIWEGTTSDTGVSSSTSGIMFTTTQSLNLKIPGKPTPLDIADNGDGRDIQVTFSGAGDETNISEYRIYVASNYDGETFYENYATGLPSTKYIVEAKNGNNGSHTITLTQGILDSSGSSITNGEPYKIYVMAVGQNGYPNRLSPSEYSCYITLTSAVVKKYNVVSSAWIAKGFCDNQVKPLIKDQLGNYYVTYGARYNGAFDHIFVRKSEDNGHTWKHWNGTNFDSAGPEVPIELSGNYNQDAPNLKIDGNGDLNVVWQGRDSVSPSYSQIRYSKLSGGSWSNPIDLTTDITRSQFGPGLEIASNNDIYVMWEGTSAASPLYPQIRYCKYSGGSWSSPEDITSGDYVQQYRSVVMDKNEDLHLIWEGKSNESQTKYQIRYSKYSGGSWSSPIDITSGSFDQGIPRIIIDNDNNLHAVWDGYCSTSTHAQVIYSKYSNGSWSEPISISNEISYYPAISIDSDSYIRVVWYEYDEMGYNQLKYRRYSGKWSYIMTLTSGNYDQCNPYIEEGTNKFVWFGNTDDSGVSYSNKGIMFGELDTPVPLPPKPAVQDAGENGDGRDIQVSFNGSSNETNISEYRIYAVPSDQAGTFNEESTALLDNTKYIVEAKNGDNGVHTVTLSQTLKDITGENIVNGRPYKIFVLAVAQNGYTDILSVESDALTLTAPGILILNDFATGTFTDTVNNNGKVEISNSVITHSEDFEDDTYNLAFTGDWIRSATTPYAGLGCYTNKDIGDNQSSTVQADVTIEANSAVSFWYRTSCESGFDKLYFYIDGVEQLGGKSGDIPWTQATFPITAGTHTLKWTYTKDSGVSVGEDSVYIDNLNISHYSATGIYTSPVIDISSVGTAKSSQISWRKNVPTNTSITIETNISLDGGANWNGWQASTNGEALVGITNGLNLSNGRLQYRAILATTDTSITPQLQDAIISITSGGAGGGDETAPTGGSVTINSGAASTSTTSITLSLFANDASEMMISNQSDFNGAVWEGYNTTKQWTLPSGDGQKTVYVKFKDAVGNESAACTGQIMLSVSSSSKHSSTVYVPLVVVQDKVQEAAEQIIKIVQAANVDSKAKVEEVRTQVSNSAKDILKMGDGKTITEVTGDETEVSLDSTELEQKINDIQKLNNAVDQGLSSSNIKRIILEDLAKINVSIANDAESLKVNLPIQSLMSAQSYIKLQINDLQIPASALKTPQIEQALALNNEAYLQIEVKRKQNNIAGLEEMLGYSKNDLVLKKKKNIKAVQISAYIVSGDQKTAVEKLNQKLIVGLNVPTTLSNLEKQKLAVYTKSGVFLSSNYNNITNKLEFKTKDLGVYRILKEEITFKDIVRNANKDYIEILASKHITEGVSKEKYAPKANLTRAQIATFVQRILEADPKGYKGKFKDVPKKKWYSGSVEAIADLGIIEGVGNNKFEPEKLISNQEFITILMRAYYYMSGETENMTGVKEDVDNIINLDNASDYAKDKIKEAYVKGIIEATGDNIIINPKGYVTREQAAKIIVNFINAIY